MRKWSSGMAPVTCIVRVARRETERIALCRDPEPQNGPVDISEIARDLIHFQNLPVAQTGTPHRLDFLLRNVARRTREPARIFERGRLPAVKDFLQIVCFKRLSNRCGARLVVEKAAQPGEMMLDAIAAPLSKLT